MRWPFLALSLVVLGGCALPRPATEPFPEAFPSTEAETARAAGLSDADLQRLTALGVPLVVPAPPPDWTLADVQTEADGYYALLYRHPDGRCFAVSGAVGGFGGPEFPLVAARVTLRNLPGTPAYNLYQATDDPLATSAQNWGPSTIVSDYVRVGALSASFTSTTEGGCRPMTMGAAGALFGTLRLVGDADTALLPPDDGPWASVDASAFPSGPDPEAALRARFAEYEAREVLIEALRHTPDRAVFVVTALGLLDDSVRDERTRVAYVRTAAGAWVPAEAERQTRCQAGRGHGTWSDARCL